MGNASRSEVNNVLSEKGRQEKIVSDNESTVKNLKIAKRLIKPHAEEISDQKFALKKYDIDKSSWKGFYCDKGIKQIESASKALSTYCNQVEKLIQQIDIVIKVSEDEIDEAKRMLGTMKQG